ncbi:MAG: galactose ABC transporter substrate-binding protein [Lachnospiraceae bacterium]|nr:galactose ABC transporter substrate-binding protein [Lachnospiraceae bacterium]MDY5741987.1 galactose ABC transporter substrate-binding protein [Lachnospiraceae bacterium]
MRFNKKLVGIGVCLVLLLLAALLWQLQNRRPGVDRKKQTIKVGICLYKGSDIFLGAILKDLEAIVKESSGDDVSIKLDVSDAKGKQHLQNEQLERYLALNYDVICMNIVDRTNAAMLIDMCAEKKVPILFFNREPVEEDLRRGERIYYIGADARASAVIESNMVVEAYHKEPRSIDRDGDGIIRYAMLEGEAGHQDTIIRTDESVLTLKNAGLQPQKVAGWRADFIRSRAAALIENYIKTGEGGKDFGGIELIISNNDDMALGAIDALEQAGIKDVAIVGIDGTPEGKKAVQDKKMLGTAVSDTAIYAKYLFQMAKVLALGEEPPASLDIKRDRYIWVPWYSYSRSK